MSPKRIAVLGGTGFVGRNVLAALERSGGECFSASRREGVDLRDPAQARTFLAACRPDVVVNCAAHVGSLNYVTQEAANVVSDNSRLILSIYEAITAECRDAIVINPIANCAYPADASIFEEEHWWDGALHRSVLSYGSTRRMLWVVGECFAMQHGVRSIYLLVPNMYGPHDSTDPNKAHALNALAAKFVKATMSGQAEIIIWGTGVAIREWLFAPDFARIVPAILDRADHPGLETPLNIAQKSGLSVRELVNIIARHIGYTGKIRYDRTMPDGAPVKIMDDHRFRLAFPDFAFTAFEDGLKQTISYYQQIYPY